MYSRVLGRHQVRIFGPCCIKSLGKAFLQDQRSIQILMLALVKKTHHYADTLQRVYGQNQANAIWTRSIGKNLGKITIYRSTFSAAVSYLVPQSSETPGTGILNRWLKRWNALVTNNVA